MAEKPTIPKGTRDFSPAEVVKRNYIFDTIKQVFRLYGFQPIETPAMENLSTLMGKYGEEGDKLLFKILNSGDYLSRASDDLLREKDSVKLTSQLSEKGLRYDLTVPFARYVVQYRNDIVFPFRRYQIQPVWRADRPQKGRYREFFQCDVDVIGSNSLLNEAELIQIIDDIFKRLKLNTVVKLNNRKILAGIAELIGQREHLTDITVAIDKLEKIGLDHVNAELAGKGIPAEAIQKLQPVLALKGTTSEILSRLEEILSQSVTGMNGLEETKTILRYLDAMDLSISVELDLTLARGLNYYTGAIIEVKTTDMKMGSICGGGRYDDLTGIFGLPDISGVGVSFGAERIYDVLEHLNLFPQEYPEITRVLFVNFGEREEAYCLPVLERIRREGINAEIYPENAKMKKQLNYANKKEIPFVALAGESEMTAQKFTLKNMSTGVQQLVTPEEMIRILLQTSAR
ncbi:MAG: histidine--tRNA ligase [Mariniphaga sp.]|nr:histidine--tRNA ligase [Mariniphaga sp.]